MMIEIPIDIEGRRANVNNVGSFLAGFSHNLGEYGGEVQRSTLA